MNTYTTLSIELEELTKYTEDSVKGYEKAAGMVQEQDPGLASFFTSQADTRRAIAERINARLQSMGRDEQEGGTVIGAVHRSLIDLKNLFTASDNVEGIVDEVIGGEETLKNFILDALNNIRVADGESERLINELKTHVESSVSVLHSRKALL